MYKHLVQQIVQQKVQQKVNNNYVGPFDEAICVNQVSF